MDGVPDPSRPADRCSPAVVAPAAHDPLYSEGIAYARRLQEAGVVTTVRIARDLIHGYFGLTAASERADAEVGLNRLVAALPERSNLLGRLFPATPGSGRPVSRPIALRAVPDLPSIPPCLTP